MHLSLLSIGLVGTQLAIAAVTFYGLDSSTSDRVECESISTGDVELADLLETSLASQAGRFDTTFMVPFDLQCDSEIATAISTLCLEVPDTVATCFPPEEESLEQRSTEMRLLDKRDNPSYCRYDGTCAYIDEKLVREGQGCGKGFEGRGLQYGMGNHRYLRCVKPCGEDHKKNCNRAACDFYRPQCTSTPANRGICGAALKNCRDPVSMQQSICGNQLIGIPKAMKCDGCTTYQGGKCVLDRNKYEAARKVYRDAQEAALDAAAAACRNLPDDEDGNEKRKRRGCLPTIGSAYGCFKRIHDFIKITEPRNTVKAVAGCGTATATPDTDATLAVSLQDASFGWTSEKSILQNVNLKVEQGSQIAIVGRVGSGKSLLMKSIVGEAERLGGTIAVTNRSVAYCGQTAWLENISAELNWTQYVASSDMSWLEKVKHACALEDVEKLSDYRHGTVGSGGVRLSGGQRQRLALARGVCAKKQMIILDDVFSALDRRTKKRVATKLLGSEGLLRQLNTTVIYTTHDKTVAALADDVYEIQEDGSLNKVSAAEIVQEPSDEEDAGNETSKVRSASTRNDPPSNDTEATKPDSTTETKSNKIESSKLIGDRLVYLRYIRAMGYPNAIIFLLTGIMFAVAFMFPNLWVQWWSNALANGDTRGNGYWLGYFALIEILPLITIFAWSMHLMLGVVPASARSLHAALLKTTLGAPFSYISRIDTGSLLNRFNQDLLFVDGFLPLDLFNTVAELLTAMFQLILIAVVANEALAVIPIAVLVLYMIQKVYLRTSKQLRNLDLESKGMLHTKFGETASGLITIRANGFVGEMRQKFIEKFDRSQEPFYLLFMAQRWLQLVLELVVAGLAVAIACVAVGLRGKVAAGAVGVAFLNVTTIGSTLTNFIIAWTSLETSLGAIARIAVFERDTPKEIADGEEKTVVSDAWPSKGHVQIENIHATYASEDEKTGNAPVWNLNNVSLEIQPGERVAVCGKTGSGKSTLLLSFMGMMRMPKGRIIVDGVNTSTINMSQLRQRFSVISQDSFVDSSTFRQELDPEHQFSDDVIVTSLKECEIWDKIRESGGLSARRIDTNMSNGQVQLLSIARLILSDGGKPGGLIVLDEATSSLDAETEAKVEEAMARRLKGKSTLSVLHRVEAAAKYDKIAVMDKGKLVDFGEAAEVIKRNSLFMSTSTSG